MEHEHDKFIRQHLSELFDLAKRLETQPGMAYRVRADFAEEIRKHHAALKGYFLGQQNPAARKEG